MKLTAGLGKRGFGAFVLSMARLRQRAMSSAVFFALVILVNISPAFAAPVISTMTPQAGPVGAVVVIVGSGFGTSQGTSTVTFNGTPVTWVSWGATRLSVQVPAGARTGNVVVKVGTASSNGKNFTVSSSPVITSLSLTSGAVGASLTITGSNFTAGGTLTPQVVFNPQVTANPTSSTDTSITVAVPAGATTGDLVVSVGGGSSNGVLFTVTSSNPSISSISPGGGVVGTAVTITGANFGSSRGTSTVTFNGTAATPTSWSGTSISVPVPTGATTGDVLVTVAGVASNTYGFEVGTAAPNITSISPTSGAVGTSVTIKGTGFGTTQGASTVTFNGVSGLPSSWSATQIKVPVPTGATTGNVVVTVGGTLSNSINFTVPGTGPTISSLSPASGPVGTSVTIAGAYFGPTQGTSTVAFNGMAAVATGWSATSIVATVPSGATSGGVVVTVSGTASAGSTFTIAPSITSLSTTSGIVGTSITITGTSFGSSQGTSSVTFNGTAATPTGWGPSSISVPVPAAASTGNVVVTVGGVASNGVNFAVAPNITSLSPTSGAVGTSVTISGTGFGSSRGTSTVTFNGTAANPTSWAAGSIAVPVPSGATTGYVVVTVGGLASNQVSFSVPLGGFVATSGQMASSRYGQTATQLLTGQVLIAGGMSGSGVLNNAELYTASSQTFATANAMNVARWLHTATLLNDGTVLIAGGSSVSSQTTLNSAEIFDPVAVTFTLLPGTLNTARVGHTATLLSNGQVLIVGGYDPASGIIADSELYDPTAQVFIDLGSTNTPRFHHTATLLQNGQVLITGGETDPTPSSAYNNAEIFNPTTWTFSPLPASLVSGREGHAATLLNDGTVLITGGDLPGAGSLNTAELYNPSTGTFNAISSVMTNARIYHDAILLNGGKVLLSGGEADSGGSSTALNTAELYDPIARQFTAVAGNMTSVREHQTTTLLNDGTVLEDGGTDGTNAFNTADIYTTSKLTGLTSIAISPVTPSVPLGAQQLLVATGTFNGGGTQVLSSVLWSSSSTSVSAVSNDGSDTGFAAGVAQGTATITATAAGISGSTTITVPAPALVSISLNPQSLAMPLGTTQQFSATGSYSDGSAQDLTSTATWTSSSSPVTVSSAGLVTAVSLGNSTIQASFGSQSGSAAVTVGAPALVSLSVSPTTASVALGLSQQYQATGTYTDGSLQNVTSSATWSLVPQAYASMNSAGLITGSAQGSLNITASYGGFDGIAVLAVGPANLVSIAVSPNSASVSAGSNQQFIATGSYTNGSTQDLTSSATWTSSLNAVSTINATGLAATLANGNTTIAASSGSVTGTAALTVQTATLTLNTSRYQHSATLLDNGQVLIAGGVTCPSAGSCTYLNSAELYNPNSGTTANTGALATARSAPAVLLGNGKVLIAGGYACDASGNCGSLRSAEIYDPAVGTFSSAGNMTTGRYGHTMTPMNSGQVLIAGGETCSSATSCSALTSAEIYDPVAGTFTPTGSLNAARYNASAIALNSGRVLVAGGFDGTNYPAVGELYDPISNTFSTTSTNLNAPRANATMTLLDGGNVLIAGGTTCSTPGCPTSVAELYSNGSFFYFSYPTSNMTVARWNQSATLLTNGQILLAGGYDACASSCASDSTTELFNPQGERFTTSQALTSGRSGHTATLLTDGTVLLVGGINNGTTLSSVDSYVPSSLSLPQLATITISPSNQPMVLGTTLPLVATGTDQYGDNLGPLPSVVWNSSSPSIASISNASGSSGIVSSESVGTSTITASIGSVNATTQVIVTAPLASLSISPSNPSVALNSVQELQLVATGIYSDGSSRNLTANVKWSSSNSSVASVTPNLTVPGETLQVTYVAVLPIAIGSTNITATLGTVSNTTSVTIVSPSTPVLPSIIAVSPTSGTAGTQVTLTGSGFGTAQGGGTVWLGSTPGTVVSWSDTQVVATVNTGSSSGVAEIQQNSLSSNSVPFAVNTATITEASPNSGLPGTQVTITGSGFGSAQVNGMVWLGTAPAVVDSWSDGQVIATVATGATTGSAQVLQNGVWSNAVPFLLDSLQVTSASPNFGSAGTVVTITGGGFGNVQGSGNVWIGNTYGVVMGWSDTQIVASVAGSAVSGVVKVEQDGVWSNALAFAVPTSLGGGTQFTLNPTVISMVVGDTRSIQAVDSNGQEVTGLTWSSNNTAVITLSTDDPPILTAVGAGSATINTGSASVDVTVYPGPTLPIGTKIWSNSGDGSGVSKIIPAVPSPSGGADVFALQNSGVVMALRSDGTQMWSANVGVGATLIPDFQGGLVVAGSSNQRLDGQTGQPTAQLSGNPVLVHTDGTIFLDGAISGVDAATGNQKFPPVQFEQGSMSVYDGGNCGEYSPITRQGPYSIIQPGPGIGQPIIAGDGYAYFPYIWADLTGYQNVCDNGSSASSLHTDFHLRILRVGTDGSSMEIKLGDWASDSGNGTVAGAIPNVAGSLITNADKGALYSWGACSANSNTGQCMPQYNLTTIAADGTPTTVSTALGATNSPIFPYALSPVQPVLQRADNSYIGTLLIPGASQSMIAFTASGQQLWSQPNYTPKIVTNGGGVIATNSSSGQTLTFDANGNQIGQLANLPVQSWKGSYQLGSVDSFYALLADLESDSYQSTPRGNVTGNGTATKQPTIGLFWCGTGYGASGACPDVNVPDVQWKYLQAVNGDNFGKAVDFSVAQPNSPAHTGWVDTIEAAALDALTRAYTNLPVTVMRVTGRKGSAWECLSQLQLTGCTIYDKNTDRVYVSGAWSPDTGQTTGVLPLSTVFYWRSLANSEANLNLNPPFPPRTSADNAAFAQLLQGIGRGIGNAAAHELGHHVQYTFTINMDCPDLQPCVGNGGVVFERNGGFPEEYKSTYPGIKWQPQSVCAIEQYYLDDRQWRDPKIGCTADYHK